jgi:hypothetical protein
VSDRPLRRAVRDVGFGVVVMGGLILLTFAGSVGVVEVLFVVISSLVLWWFIVTPVHRLRTSRGYADPIAFGALTMGLALNLYSVATLGRAILFVSLLPLVAALLVGLVRVLRGA